MSSKQRRANAPTPPQQQQQQQPTQSQRPVDMTLPQVLQLLETRLRKLEQAKPATTNLDTTTTTTPPQIAEVISSWKEFQAEYESRFNLLATEINQLKDIVMKLQSYTMDVNKTLLEERVHFMSEEKENIVMQSTTEEEEDE